MSSTTKRKTPDGLEHEVGESSKRRFVETATQEDEDTPVNAEAKSENVDGSDSQADERRKRFEALKARQSQSRKANHKESVAENQRLQTDPNLLTALNRKHAIASHKLLKADVAAAGEDFERKRAWDWTVDEAEKWDRRMEKKEKHRQDVAFQDFTQHARKVYKRQIRDFKPDLEAYEKSKMEAVQRSVQGGGMEIVETEDGELIAVDKDGSFYSTSESTDFVNNKPDKSAIDRLVNDIRKAEEMRMKKRRDRGKGDDDEDVTYINEKNKQFNQKLARFYNKYTADIRDSFERGTAI
ncbi:MAG: pre-mRNA-splicing factor syf2 [Bathelium mastoideum]|nr:MAG: pre-mRNA-splicing factor syf2 [Bathelium mastoideum]KAI9685160.1 MAG: pre-mRNA-splicing factor syf2 [Bathelium mastoideum]